MSTYPSRQSREEREEGQEDQKDGEERRVEDEKLLNYWVFPSKIWPGEGGGEPRGGEEILSRGSKVRVAWRSGGLHAAEGSVVSEPCLYLNSFHSSSKSWQ